MISLASTASRYTYQSLVGYDATFAPGGPAVKNCYWCPPIEGRNNFGERLDEDQTSPPGFWQEGGSLSNFANAIPGINGVAGLHDVFQNRLGDLRDNQLLNVGGMVPAAAMTYGALLDRTGTYYSRGR